jgi:hypothetical protein
VCTSGGVAGSAATLGLATTNTTGSSVTGVPLGHYTIKATSGTKTGSMNVWVKPDGVYQVDLNGNATSILTGPITLAVS